MKLQYDKKEIEAIKKEHTDKLLKIYKYQFKERESGEQKEVQLVMKEPSEASTEAWISLTPENATSATREYLADNILGRDRKEVLAFLTKYIGVAGAMIKKYSADFQGVSDKPAKSENL